MLNHRLFTSSYRFQQIDAGKDKLKKGDCCEEVRRVQTALKALEYDMPGSFNATGPDGGYGNETRDTIEMFQSDYCVNCKKAGQVDQATLRMLDQQVPKDTEVPGPWGGYNGPEQLKNRVLGTLNSAGVDYLYYLMGFRWMYPSMMYHVKKAINADQIRIRLFLPTLHNPDAVIPWGKYFQTNTGDDANSLFLNSTYAKSSWTMADPAFYKSIIIHECTHALHDVLQMNMSVLDTETMAYLNQAIYYRATNLRSILKAPDYLITDSNDKNVLRAADKIAIVSLYGKELDPSDPADAAVLATTPATSWTPSVLNTSELEAAIKAHPLYSGNYAEGADYDGM